MYWKDSKVYELLNSIEGSYLCKEKVEDTENLAVEIICVKFRQFHFKTKVSTLLTNHLVSPLS